MSKKEFLEKLEHKLHLLKQDEIQDILDEYSGYIDNKLQEGKTEDEAVADFGNLDDLAREILSAYKIDDKYTHDKSRDIIDNVVDIMTQGIDSAVTYFTQHFNNLSVEAVIRLVALILIALVVIGLIKIPFSLLETLATGLLRVILPNFLAAPLNLFVRLAINLIYLCLVVLLMASFISRGLENKELALRDLIEKPFVFNFHWHHGDAGTPRNGTADTLNPDGITKAKNTDDKAGEALAQAEAAVEIIDRTEAEITQTLEDEDKRILEDPIDPLIQPRASHPYYYNEEGFRKKSGWGVGKAAARLMIGIVQLITLMIVIPFGLGEFVFCFAFGLLVFLLFQGAKLWGVTLICLGLAGIFHSVVSRLWRIVRPAAKKRSLFPILIASLVITGIGVPWMMVEFSRYQEVPISQDFPELVQTETIHLTPTEELDQVRFSFYYEDVVFRNNPNLGNGSLQLTLPPGQYKQQTDLSDSLQNQEMKSLNIYAVGDDAEEFKNGLKIFLRGLREGKWYTSEAFYAGPQTLIVEASQPTLDQLEFDENQSLLMIHR